MLLPSVFRLCGTQSPETIYPLKLYWFLTIAQTERPGQIGIDSSTGFYPLDIRVRAGLYCVYNKPTVGLL